MSLKKQAISGVFWTGLQQFGSQGINFIVSIILARLLLPSEFGLVALIGVFISLGNAFINSGLTNSLIRSENVDDVDFSTVFYFNLIVSVFFYILVFLLAPFISTFYKQPLLIDIIRLYGITFIINAFSTVQSTRLTKILDFKSQMLISIPSIILGGGVGITLAYFNFGVWSLVWSAIIQSISNTLQLWIRSKWKPLFVFDFLKFKKHFNFGVKLLLSSLLEIVFSNIYTLIFAKFFSPTQVGFYNRSNTFVMFPVGSISLIITRVTFPIFSTIQEDKERLKSVYKRIIQLALYLITPILVMMSVMAEPIFRFLFTEKWLPAVVFFQILCINGILYPIHSYNLQILNILGRSDLFLKLEIIKKLITLVLIFSTFKYGIIYLLIGSVINSIISFFINTYYTGKFINYNSLEQLKDLFPIFGLSFLTGFIVFLIDSVLNSLGLNDFTRILISVTIGFSSFLLFSHLIKIPSYIEVKNLILKK